MDLPQSPTIQDALRQVERVILGKPEPIRLAMACLIAGGHLLLDDLPGMGKTTLARTLAHTLGMSFLRVQFTSDMLPADILGVSIYEQATQNFRFHPGPVFTQALLADEINRASPRTQSALLEAMAENQVTVDGVTRDLPAPFFVIATQNPVDMSGTFPLPDSQLDRFLIRLHLGYPDEANEIALLAQDGAVSMDHVPSLLRPEAVLDVQNAARAVKTSEPLVAYIQKLVAATRTANTVRIGLSPRAGLALLRMARSLALLDGRDHAIPEDVQKAFSPVALHRIQWRAHVAADDAADETRANLLKEILERVQVP